MSFHDKIKQYGFKNSIKRFFKLLLRKIGVQYESFLLLENRINKEELIRKMQKYDYADVKELTPEDFSKDDPSIFNDKKMSLIKSRFESGKYWAYGIMDNEVLAYSCWITTDKIRFPEKYKKEIKLKEKEGFLEDAYCHPDYRGKGFHSKMNLYRLQQLMEKNRQVNFVILLSENIPALKSQLKSGFKISKKISFLSLWGKQFVFEKNK